MAKEKLPGGRGRGDALTGGGQINETPSGIRHTSDSNESLPRGVFVEQFGPPIGPLAKSPGAKSTVGTIRPKFKGAFWGEKIGSKAGEQ